MTTMAGQFGRAGGSTAHAPRFQKCAATAMQVAANRRERFDGWLNDNSIAVIGVFADHQSAISTVDFTPRRRLTAGGSEPRAHNVGANVFGLGAVLLDAAGGGERAAGGRRT